jgi:Ca2+-binding RTX toxin-like protein
MTSGGRALVAVTLAVVALPGWAAVTVSASGAVTPRCFGEEATIVGTPAKETLRGTAAADVIVGGGGSDADGVGDKIIGLGGDDRICVDPADPVITLVYGGGGNDSLRGSALMIGGPGPDRLVEPAPIYTDVFMVGGKGADLLQSRAIGISYFVPGPGDDTLTAKVGDNIHNEVDFGGADRGVIVDLSTQMAVGQGSDSLSGINFVYGTKQSDVILGNADDNFMLGRGGDDVLVGRGNGDPIVAGGGDDHVDGGPGDDSLVGDRGRDTLMGRGGNDELVEERRSGANLLLAGSGRDRCYGGYRVPPNIERGCEAHRPSPHPPGPGADQVSPNGATMYRRLIVAAAVPNLASVAPAG